MICHRFITRLLLALSSVFVCTAAIHAQQLIVMTDLAAPLKETSGLIYLNGNIITHTDSGGDPILYEIDPSTGTVIRSVVVDNAQNVDWEDICHDDTYIYIGDFGNNDGVRTNLTVYRILISDYHSSSNDTVPSEKIRFSYADQADFKPSAFTTNFDAEAFIAIGDSLYIFTKNWGNQRTNLYALSKTPGTYSIDRMDSLNTQGLVTGATFHPDSNRIILCGYTFNFPMEPFITSIEDFTLSNLSNGRINRHSISVPAGYSPQIEGITFTDTGICLSAESNSLGASALFKLPSTFLDVHNQPTTSFHIYPNPTSDYIYLDIPPGSSFELYNSLGDLVRKSTSSPISLADLGIGIYLLHLYDEHGALVNVQRIVVR